MTDRAQFPSSPACGQWETLLADALDGLLQPEDEATFTAHMAGCKACAALFDEARRGREWLEFLSPEPEVPAGLLDKILAQTGPGQVAGFGLAAGAAGVLPIHPVGQTRNSRLAAAGLYGAGSPLCRAAPADDGSHGFLLHRPHPQFDRRPPGRSSHARTSAPPPFALSWNAAL